MAAPTTGSVQLLVRDSSGAAVTGAATITVDGDSSGWSAVGSGSGVYLKSGLTAKDDTSITVSVSGFAARTVTVRVEAGRTATVPVVLERTSVGLTVSVRQEGGSTLTPSSSQSQQHHYCHAPTTCLLYTSPSPRDKRQSRMPSSA